MDFSVCPDLHVGIFDYICRRKQTINVMKVVLAIDSFKGCLSSREANSSAAEGVLLACPEAEVVEVAVSDGGEGFVEAFHFSLGGKLVELEVHDPLMRKVKARYLLYDETAVIEVASASGLTLVAAEERNVLLATSYGTGELVADAIRRGAKHIVVGLGGSATSDAGTGMLKALVDAFAPQGKWDDITVFDGVRFTIASDVDNPLFGKNGAAFVYSPQKGASDEQVLLLDERARRFAAVSSRHLGHDRSSSPGAGAAGGIGYAFLQYLNAEYRSGIELLLEAIGYDTLVSGSDLVITGEGSADRQTLMGKLPMGVLKHSRHVPVCLIAGKVAHREMMLDAGFRCVECINPPGTTTDQAMRKEIAQHNIRNTVRKLIERRAGNAGGIGR